MVDFLTIIGKLALGLVLLLVIFRLLGRKTLDQITPIDFITTVIMADLIVEMSVDDKVQVWQVAGVIITWAILTFLLDYLKYKSKKFRKLTAGEPVTLMENGQLNREVLKRERMTEDELREMLRQHGVFYPWEVELAVLEINGKISVKKRSDK